MLKENVKQYLKEQHICRINDIIGHIEFLKGDKDASTEKRNLLLDLIICFHHKKDELEQFFREDSLLYQSVNNMFDVKIVSAGKIMEEGAESKKAYDNMVNLVDEIQKRERLIYPYYLDEVIFDWKYNNTRAEADKVDDTIISEKNKGIKESKDKLFYEISWEFVEEMAKRMANNKSEKYPIFNWKKEIDTEELKQAITRHHIEVMKGNYKDGDEEFGHVISYACNAMMLWQQLKNK